ncbi:MAG TPA: PqqD family peptide modification chaperone [Sphingomicrobium sp.]|nr:PqqD family peptide modification chaperone [Sphingomicrobium sp.]
MAEVQPKSVVALANNHFRADHDGSAIIMSISAGKFFSFDDIGFEIWDAIQSPVCVNDLVATLAAKHDAPEDVVMPDVLTFLNKLSDNELITVE